MIHCIRFDNAQKGARVIPTIRRTQDAQQEPFVRPFEHESGGGGMRMDIAWLAPMGTGYRSRDGRKESWWMTMLALVESMDSCHESDKTRGGFWMGDKYFSCSLFRVWTC